MALTVTIHRAKDLKSCDWLSNNDPFVVTSVIPHTDAGQRPWPTGIENEKREPRSHGAWRTHTIYGGGAACEWNESHHFDLSVEELGWKCLQFVCWDDDGGDDDCIGYAHITLGDLARCGSVRGWHLLKGLGRGTPHGSLEVELSFAPRSRPPTETPAAPASGLPGLPASAPPGVATGPPPGFGATPAVGPSIQSAAAVEVVPSVPVADCVIVNPRDIVIASKNLPAVSTGAAMLLDSCECLELGLAWDLDPGRPVDLDAQCVLFDYAGKFVDVAYYNNLKAAGGAVKHSGDDRTGEGGGYDERIVIHVHKLPKEIEYAVFIVSAHDDGATLASVVGCHAELRDTSRGQVPRSLVSTTCETQRLVDEGSVIVAIFYRDLDVGEWHLREVGTPCPGHHFRDCEDAISKELSVLMPDDLANGITMDGARSLSMTKGDAARLPTGCNLLTVGLGWECRGKIDLDAAVLVLRDVDGDGVQDVTHVVNYKNLRESFAGCPGSHGCVAIQHMGDNTTGQGRGDDETVHVLLDYLVSDCQLSPCFSSKRLRCAVMSCLPHLVDFRNTPTALTLDLSWLR
eukprot:COSAG02_NODE_1834_length_10718_cov_3.893775_6_plen_572_part_00